MNLHDWNRLTAGDIILVHTPGHPLLAPRFATVIGCEDRHGHANVVSVVVGLDRELTWPDRDTVHLPPPEPICWRCAAAGTRPQPPTPPGGAPP